MDKVFEFLELYSRISELNQIVKDFNDGKISGHEYNIIMKIKRKELQEYEEKIHAQKGAEREGLQE